MKIPKNNNNLEELLNNLTNIINDENETKESKRDAIVIIDVLNEVYNIYLSFLSKNDIDQYTIDFVMDAYYVFNKITHTRWLSLMTKLVDEAYKSFRPYDNKYQNTLYNYLQHFLEFEEKNNKKCVFYTATINRIYYDGKIEFDSEFGIKKYKK